MNHDTISNNFPTGTLNINGEHGKAIFGNDVVNVVNNIYALPGDFERALRASENPTLSPAELTNLILDQIDSTPRIPFSEFAHMSISSFKMIEQDLRNGKLLIEWDTPKTNQLVSHQPSARQLIDIASFNTNYYQLIVTTQPDVFDTNIVHMMKNRALCKQYVPDVIFNACSSLSPEGIEILKKMPAIICQENTDYEGRTDSKQRAVYARIKDILPSYSNIDIVFEPIAVFPQSKMCEPLAAAYFGLTMDCYITTLNHTAWSVIQRNLFKAFEESSIEGMPGPKQEH